MSYTIVQVYNYTIDIGRAKVSNDIKTFLLFHKDETVLVITLQHGCQECRKNKQNWANRKKTKKATVKKQPCTEH